MPSPEPTISPNKKLSEETLFAKIEERLKRNDAQPAYTLILGSGISYGIVPTTREILGFAEKGRIHENSIPKYLAAKSGAPPDDKILVRNFWAEFIKKNPTALPSKCDADGLPQDIPAAYQAIFSTAYVGGLNEPDAALAYLRHIMPRGEKIRLNGAHFYLASLLALQKTPATPDNPKPLYIGQRPFAQTIFTTNFDPLLQIALQLFNVLYYMSDMPSGLNPDIFSGIDDRTIHLFYAHGSIYRNFLANNTAEIDNISHNNARIIRPELKERGVIVLGYSGWDDCLMTALSEIASFDGNLYWLARRGETLSAKAQELLSQKPNAYLVEIDDADNWMNALHRRLCPQTPFTRLLQDPITLLREQIDGVNLDGIKALSTKPTSASAEALAMSAEMQDTPPEQFRKTVTERLKEAEHAFANSVTPATLKNQAAIAYEKDDWSESIKLSTAIIERADTSSTDKALAYFRRAFSHGQLNAPEKAVADYSAVIAMPDAPSEQKAKALVNRGVTYGQMGKPSEAIADYSAAIAMSDAPSEQKANALFNCGVTYGEMGKHSEAIADYSAVIVMPDAPSEQKARAFVYRGFTYGKMGKHSKAIADFYAVIAMSDAPSEQKADALVNRGFTYGKMGKSSEAIADYSAVIAMPDVPSDVKQSAQEALDSLRGEQDPKP